MTSDPRIRAVADPSVTRLFDLVVDLKPPLDFGKIRQGRRIFFEAAGGSFFGERLRGKIISGGDWALFDANGDLSLDVRLTLCTDDDAFINMGYRGLWITPPELRSEIRNPNLRHRIDPQRYYFRTTPFFEVATPNYDWLNDIVCVGTGYAIKGGVAYRIFQID